MFFYDFSSQSATLPNDIAAQPLWLRLNFAERRKTVFLIIVYFLRNVQGLSQCNFSLTYTHTQDDDKNRRG